MNVIQIGHKFLTIHTEYSYKLIKPHIDKIYLHAKDLYKVKYQFLINERKNTGLMHFNNTTAFIEYSNDMDGIYKNIEEYNPNKKRKI